MTRRYVTVSKKVKLGGIMKFAVGALLAASLMTVPGFAQKSAEARLTAATQDLKDLMTADDKGVPQDLFNKAACVIVIPNLKAGGFIVGGQYGKGFFSCRKESGHGWSSPGSLKLTGGKFGLLIGGKETDVMMLVMNREGMSKLLTSKFQIGGEASGAAGPVGRDSSAMTDAMMHAQILSYSRSRGVFGGLDLGGSAVTEDVDANKELYGKAITNKEIMESQPVVPMPARAFIHQLNSISSRK
jgi:lipid-binding SYLF domain-containing protein